jgi:hypothetical protein
MPVKTVRTKKTKKGNGWWREDQKIDAVAQYLIFGNLSEVARVTKIPRDTIAKWKGTDWWADTEAEIRKESNQEIQGKLSKVLKKSLAVVEDRLEKGDFVYDPKSGSIKRIGVKASVANQITKDSIDRKVLLEKISNKGTNSDEAVATRLASLRTEFLKFVNSKQIEGVKDAEFTELQAQLPAREQVQSTTGTDQSTSSPQQG